METTPPPADAVQHSTFVSDDDEQIAGFIRDVYADHRSTFVPTREGARFSARTHDAVGLGADRLRTSVAYSGTSPGTADLVLYVVHAGRVQVGARGVYTRSGPGDAGVYPLGVPVTFAKQAFDVTTPRLPVARVRQVAGEATGEAGGPWRLLGTTPVSAPMLRYWRGVVRLVSGALADPASPLGAPLLADATARTVAAAVLHVFPGTTSTLQHVPGPGRVAPAAVRRAVAHLEANADRPVQLSEVAAAAGTSARALQHGFRRHLGTTPLGHLRRVRLERARQELLAADPATAPSVAAVAARWGSASPSAFTAAYRAAHGETPSATLRR